MIEEIRVESGVLFGNRNADSSLVFGVWCLGEEVMKIQSGVLG